jgi:hypothetical protein
MWRKRNLFLVKCRRALLFKVQFVARGLCLSKFDLSYKGRLSLKAEAKNKNSTLFPREQSGILDLEASYTH